MSKGVLPSKETEAAFLAADVPSLVLAIFVINFLAICRATQNPIPY